MTKPQTQKSIWEDKHYLFGDAKRPTDISVEKVIVIKLKNGKTFQFAAHDVETCDVNKLFLFKNYINKDNKACSFLLGPVLSKEETDKPWEIQAFDAYEADLKKRQEQSKKKSNN